MNCNTSESSLKKMHWKGLTLTKTATQQFKKLISNNNKNVKGLRLNIKKSGCAGFSYRLDLVLTPNKEDIVFTYSNICLYISQKLMPLLDGTEIDFISQGINKIFTFKNPNAQNVCGCGISFNIE
ncbi:iron-sulfur cluster assembly accessory protein [Candidatus Tachikawaea gelatinosa]|uniref:Uncharacterized conserved protein SufA n=1 Tax=Candidatus Tachikawaea gelatinosa TaxID=1410383 RepID=A0A090BWI5_9ENTR|nr:iron-sulfur cluster assembly accessory protein [Candidatus Tachikawaea gelatinosa]BAP58666.1 uncharacterized conserved protein SufA [Candidatus Tachikawaea gelatinosa]